MTFLVFLTLLALSLGDSSSCESDAKLFCPSEKPSSRCAQFKCLSAHLDQLSAPCATYLREKLSKKESCKADTEAFCANEEGKYAIRRCLIQHVDQLSNATCAEYIRAKKAQYAAPPNVTACDADATTLCSSSTGFTSSLICIKANYEKLSKDCRILLWKLKRNQTSDDEHSYHGSHHGSHHGWRRHRGSHRGSHHGSHRGSHRGSSHRDGSGSGSHKSGSGSKKSHKDWSGSKKSHKDWSGSKKKSHKDWSSEKKSECTRKLKQACSQDLATNCPKEVELQAMKSCLREKEKSLTSDCLTFLNKYKKDDTEKPLDGVTSEVITISAVAMELEGDVMDGEN